MLCQMQLKKIKAVATKGRGFFCDRTSAVVFWDTVLEFEREDKRKGEGVWIGKKMVHVSIVPK